METKINKCWQWLKGLPVWLRVVVLVLLSSFVLIFSMTSCGTPKTVAEVKNVQPNSTVTLSLTVSNNTTSNPTVNAQPSVQVSPAAAPLYELSVKDR